MVAFTNYKDYIGMDLTSLVTLPVWIMEPYTILQKVAEIMEYTEQLDRAAATEDPYERHVCDHHPLSSLDLSSAIPQCSLPLFPACFVEVLDGSSPTS